MTPNDAHEASNNRGTRVMSNGNVEGWSGDSQRVAVVTGAASGIGRSLALQLAGAGYHLHISDRDAEGLATTADDAGRRSILSSTVVDITDVDAVKSWANELVATHGVPNEVHHVAGIAIWGNAATMPHEKWKKVIDVNLMGTIHMVEAFVPHLISPEASNRSRRLDRLRGLGRRLGRGRGETQTQQFGGGSGRRKFVCVSSAAGIVGLPWHAAYSASKGGVIGMCEVLRFDLAPQGVDVHVVAPGAVDTPLVSTIDIDGVDQRNERVVKAKKLFQGHAITPDDAAAAIIRGVEKNKYMIFTSGDIAFGRWAQVNIPFAYRGFMRLLNRGFRWAAKDSAK